MIGIFASIDSVQSRLSVGLSPMTTFTNTRLRKKGKSMAFKLLAGSTSSSTHISHPTMIGQAINGVNMYTSVNSIDISSAANFGGALVSESGD